MRTLAVGLGIVALLIAASPRLTLDLSDADDPHPRRVEIAASLAGSAAVLALQWTARRLEVVR